MSIRFEEVYENYSDKKASKGVLTVHCYISGADLISTDLVTSLSVIKSAMVRLRSKYNPEITKLRRISFWSDQTFCPAKSMKHNSIRCSAFFAKWQAIGNGLGICCWWNFKCDCTNNDFDIKINYYNPYDELIENYTNILNHIKFNQDIMTHRIRANIEELQLMLGKQDIALSQALLQLNKHRYGHNHNYNYGYRRYSQEYNKQRLEKIEFWKKFSIFSLIRFVVINSIRKHIDIPNSIINDKEYEKYFCKSKSYAQLIQLTQDCNQRAISNENMYVNLQLEIPFQMLNDLKEERNLIDLDGLNATEIKNSRSVIIGKDISSVYIDCYKFALQTIGHRFVRMYKYTSEPQVNDYCVYLSIPAVSPSMLYIQNTKLIQQLL